MANIYSTELAVDVARGATMVLNGALVEVVGRRHSFADQTVSFVVDDDTRRFPVTVPFDAAMRLIVG